VEQIERSRRYLERIRQIYAGVPDRDDARDYYRDDVESFFLHSYSIVYWAAELNRAGLPIGDMHTYVNAHEELRICADLANGLKHFDLNNLRTDHQPHVARINRLGCELEDGRSVTRMTFGVMANGKLWDALELAEECMVLWDELSADLEQLVDPSVDVQ
jgi:hypothetical protein